jgi:nucleotide-binding universal stress UspA family protein
MSARDPSASAPAAPTGPVLFAYDGCGLAKLAIEQAGQQLARGREALVVCVWQPGDVGFLPVSDRHLNAAEATEVREAAEETAAHGASLAEQAGFRAQSMAVQAAPTWKGIVAVAAERGASLIVLGAHRRSGLVGHLLGSVTAAVMAHCACPVLIVQQPHASPAETPGEATRTS